MTMSKELLIIKLKATAIHFSLSIVVFVVLAYLILFHWYPQPYFTIDGGWQGMRIIAAVDLVLGPLITFLVFDLRKSRRAILFDLVFILVIQLGSLTYGIHTTYTQRPVAIVMLQNFVMPVTTVEYGDRLTSLDQLHEFSPEKPPIIYAQVPQDANTDNAMQNLLLSLEEQIKNRSVIAYYQPFEAFAPALRARQQKALESLRAAEMEADFDDWLDANDHSRESVMLEMFAGRYGTAWLVFDLDGRYLGYFLGLVFD